MKAYTLAQIQAILQGLNLKDSQTLLIHSALQNFGILQGYEIARIPQVWLHSLLELTSTHNLIVPTFNYDFPESHLEDLRFQQSKIGILNEEFRKIAPLRSTHPMFNFCGFGRNAEKILQPTALETNPFLQTSVFHRLFLENALMLFLGIDLRVCTFMVYVEAMCGVKYRFFKPFLGEVITHNGQRLQGEFYHFCLPQSEKLKVSYHRIQQDLLCANILQFFPLGGSGIYTFRAKEFFYFVQNRLRQEPFILLETPPKTHYQWINNAEQIIGGGGAKSHKILCNPLY